MPNAQTGYNILFITSDQQRADCYGFEGRKVKTPHLDEMARNGTRFLREAALDLVKDGVTTLKEINRVTFVV